MGTSVEHVLGIPNLNDETVWYNERLTDDLTKQAVLGPASVSLGNDILRKLFNEWGKGRWRSFFEHSTETQCKSAGAFPNHTCYICGFPIRNSNGSHPLGAQCEHIIACVQLILLCGLAGEEWEDSINDILDSLGIPRATKEEYKVWRAGIVGEYGRMQGLADAEEGGGKVGISYLYAHPACNSLKDNDQFIRIMFDPDGTIKIICTVHDYYKEAADGQGGGAAAGASASAGAAGSGAGWRACVKKVVPTESQWNPRDHIPDPMNASVFTELTSAEVGDIERIYSSICWKNIYWILCSLVGYNLILKTRVRGVTAKKGVSEGGTKTVDWRRVVFAPWTQGVHKHDWTPQMPLLSHHESILSNTQAVKFFGKTPPTDHPNGSGIGVYRNIPYMQDSSPGAIIKTEDWIKHRADRIGQHLLPLIRNIQTVSFEANSQSFGLISALVFAHRLDRKIKKEKDKFDEFEQFEISAGRPYVDDVLSIKFQVDAFNLMVSKAKLHNFELASSKVGIVGSAVRAASGWKDWLLSYIPTELGTMSFTDMMALVSGAGGAAPAADGHAGGGATTSVKNGGADTSKTHAAAAPGLALPGTIEIITRIYDDAIESLETCKTREESTVADQILDLVKCHNYGWVVDTTQPEMRSLEEFFNKVVSLVNDHKAIELIEYSMMEDEGFSDFQEIFGMVIDNVIMDIHRRKSFAMDCCTKRPGEVETFYNNFGLSVSRPLEDSDIKVTVPPNNYGGGFTDYIANKRKNIMENRLEEFRRILDEERARMGARVDPDIFGEFLFDAFSLYDPDEHIPFSTLSGHGGFEILSKYAEFGLGPSQIEQMWSHINELYVLINNLTYFPNFFDFDVGDFDYDNSDLTIKKLKDILFSMYDTEGRAGEMVRRCGEWSQEMDLEPEPGDDGSPARSLVGNKRVLALTPQMQEMQAQEFWSRVQSFGELVEDIVRAITELRGRGGSTRSEIKNQIDAKSGGSKYDLIELNHGLAEAIYQGLLEKNGNSYKVVLPATLPEPEQMDLAPPIHGLLKKTRKRRKKKYITHKKKKKKNQTRNKPHHKKKKKKRSKRTSKKENSLYQKILKRLGY